VLKYITLSPQKIAPPPEKRTGIIFAANNMELWRSILRGGK
jgi:hypothetical protein